MRFAVADDSDSDYELQVVMDMDSSSDESYHVPDLRRRRKSKLSQNIADFLASSSESDNSDNSEDEVGDMLDMLAPSTVRWRSPRKGKSRAPAPAPRMSRSSAKLPAAGPSWRRWEPTVDDLLREESSQYTQWIKSTEAEAWREGHRVAGERRSRLRELEQRARAEQRASQGRKRDAADEELRKMMQGLAVRQKKEEEDSAKLFAARERQLWQDVDAAIRNAEKKAAEEQAQRVAAEKRRKEEEAAKLAAQEQAALRSKAEAEKAAKEKAEQEAAKRAQEEREAAEALKAQQDAEAKEKLNQAAAEEGSRGEREWVRWVDLQRKVKTEIIEPGKAAGLKKKTWPQAKLLTRRLGQITNNREKIVSATNEIHTALAEHLPAPPSASNPVTFESMPPAYGYMLSVIAKRMVRQAVANVGAHDSAAYPLARIAVGLILRGHAAFSQMLFSRMVKKCPWVVPHAPRRQQGQSREEYEKSTGRSSEESDQEYIYSMTAIMRLYFAILQTPLAGLVNSTGQQPTSAELAALVDPVMRLPAAWTWMAMTLRPAMATKKPTAHFLVEFWKSAGHVVLKTYGKKQVDKVMAALERGLEADQVKGDSPAVVSKLKDLVQSYKASGSLAAPKDRMWE